MCSENGQFAADTAAKQQLLQLGPGHGALHDDIVPKLKCSKCGGKEIGLIMSPAETSVYVLRGAHKHD